MGTQDIRDEDCSVLRRTGMSRLGRGSLRPALERDGPDDHLVVDGSQGSANEGADPEDPLQNNDRNTKKVRSTLRYVNKEH